MTVTSSVAHRFKSQSISAAVTKTIKSFSADRRNTVRGIIADAQRAELSTDKINELRNNTTEADMVCAAAILIGPNGLLKRTVFDVQPGKISRPHAMECRSSLLEAAYACGFLNAWALQSLSAIETIWELAHLIHVGPNDAISMLETAALQWGASNYLARKIGYVKEFIELDEDQQAQIDRIDALTDHNEYPQLQYSALELLKEHIPLLSLARRYTNLFKETVGSDFRRNHHLNNLVATPFSRADCAGFFLRAVETSLLDTVFSILVIFNLKDRFPTIVATITRNLDSAILERLLWLADQLANEDYPNLFAEGEVPIYEHPVRSDHEDRSLAIYRRSISFLEFAPMCSYRNDLDCVIGHRLVAPLLADDVEWRGLSFDNPAILKRENDVFELDIHDKEEVKLDIFYRTYLFLRFIQDPKNLSLLTSEDIQYIFDSTMGLENLILENELRTMHLNASDDARALISVLALSLYRSKSSDPDIDFDFREQLESFITKNFDGDISRFIENLAPNSPSVANYIATSLDEATLQKMYSIVDSPSVAENVRAEILTIIGQRLNKIEYIMEAEGIATRAKVSILKDYFDASRMYVDSLAMKKWLSSNPSAYTEQYKEILPKIMARLSRGRAVMVGGEETTVDIIEITRTDEYLIEQIAAEAFTEFCANNEFGIESYLGRRIRHNTLHGVMTNSVDAVLKRPGYHPIIVGTPFGAALGIWESTYKIYIERMRREFLQFKADSKPNALFDSRLDAEDAATRRNLQQLVHTLRLSGAEMLHDLIISFCWRQIGPQLESASRYIRVKMAGEVIQSLDQTLQRFNGPEEHKIKSELSDALAAVFAQVASWFQIPQTGFVPASISDICNIIDIEHNRAASTTIVVGDLVGHKYYGISVHRIYDCLAVLLQNAFKHGRRMSAVKVEVRSDPIDGTSLRELYLSVSSQLPAQNAAGCVERVAEAVTSSETGKVMVTEGYSGIKKVKFITRLNEGQSTVSHTSNGDEITITFHIKAEVASGEKGHEADTLD